MKRRGIEREGSESVFEGTGGPILTLSLHPYQLTSLPVVPVLPPLPAPSLPPCQVVEVVTVVKGREGALPPANPPGMGLCRGSGKVVMERGGGAVTQLPWTRPGRDQ